MDKAMIDYYKGKVADLMGEVPVGTTFTIKNYTANYKPPRRKRRKRERK